jgi:CheY-like chemotaxis protein
MKALRKILVVDDDPVVATSFNRVLSREGYVVVSAHDGAEALEKLNEGDYDVVYTDIKMPGMDGLELAERVKARRSWTPVVIITGYGSEASERRAKAAGVTAFLHKPLSPEMIETSARDAIEVPAPTIAAIAEAVALPRVVAPEAAAPAREVGGGVLKRLAMLAAGPFIGLAFILALPVVGLAMLAGMALRRFVEVGGHRHVGQYLKNVGLFVAAPFIGLGYILLMPFIGMALLAGVAVHGTKK